MVACKIEKVPYNHQNFTTMQDLIIALPSAKSSRAEKRKELCRVGYYQKFNDFLNSRFEDGKTYFVKNYFEEYKLTIKDYKGNDWVLYGLIVNDRTYISFNDLALPRRLYKREYTMIDGEEAIIYTQIDEKVYQGDLSVMFHAFKSKYKDGCTAFDLVYLAIAKHNESKFVAESFIYPNETFQRFKGEFTTSNFYLFNLKKGGTSERELAKIVEDICKDYDNSQNQ